MLLDTLKLEEPCGCIKIDIKNKQLVAAGSLKYKIYIYDISNVKQVKKLKDIESGHQKPIRTLDILDNGFVTTS